MLAAHPHDVTKTAGLPGVQLKDVNTELAIPICEAAVRDAPGNLTSKFNVGRLYSIDFDKGKSINSDDIRRARQYLTIAAEGGHAVAMTWVGAFSLGGKFGFKEDEQASSILFQRAVDRGYTGALVSLAVNYTWGWGVAKDCDKANSLLDRAIATKVRSTLVSALDTRANMKWRGLCAEKNIPAAIAYYREMDRVSGASDAEEKIAEQMKNDSDSVEASRQWQADYNQQRDAQRRCRQQYGDTVLGNVRCGY